MGIRAALESLMIDKVGDNGSFKANMDAFQVADYLNGRQRGHLEAVLGPVMRPSIVDGSLKMAKLLYFSTLLKPSSRAKIYTTNPPTLSAEASLQGRHARPGNRNICYLGSAIDFAQVD